MPDLNRIKANAASMIDQGASEAEVETYIASEGVTAQDLRGARMSPQAEADYMALAADPRSTAASLQGYVRAQGFDLTDEEAQSFIAARSQNPAIGGPIEYQEPPAPPPPPSVPNSLSQSIRGTAGAFLDGILPGSAATVRGFRGITDNAVSSLFGRDTFDPGKAYTEYADDQKHVQAQLGTDHPNLSAVAGWGGFADSFLLPGANVLKGGGVLRGVVNGAATGAAYGGLTGVLNDTGGGRLENAANGVLAGGALGGTAAPVAQRMGSTIATARRNVPGVNSVLTAAENIPRRLTGQPLIPATAAAHAQAERLINRQMEGATIDTGAGLGTVPASPQAVADEVARRGALSVPAMPADVSENLRTTAAWALKGHGTMSSRARNTLQVRQAQAAPRVRQHIIDELGATVDPIAEVEAIHRRASAASAPGYQAAYAQPIVITPEIAGIMGTPAFQDAVPQAVRNVRNAQRDPQALGFTLDAEGNIGGMDTLSTEGFDQVIRAMRDNGAAAMDTSGFRPRNTTNSVHINGRAGDLRGALAAQNPAYADVTTNYADEMALRDALERGGDVAKLSGNEIEAQRRHMPAANAQEGWMAGARTALADAATQVGLKPTANVAQPIRNALGLSGAGALAAPGDLVKQQAIEAMSGRPGVLSRLDDRFEAEDQAYRTYAAASRPSASGGALDAAAPIAGVAIDAARKLARGNPVGALASVVLKGNPRGTFAYRGALQDRTAEMLTATEPQAVQAHMGALSQRFATDEARQGVLFRKAGNLAKVGALYAASQDASPLADDYGSLSDQQAPYASAGVLQAPLYGRSQR